ncbi:hypothetical protein ACFLWU_03695 [Chloroflexota bacterium]
MSKTRFITLIVSICIILSVLLLVGACGQQAAPAPTTPAPTTPAPTTPSPSTPATPAPTTPAPAKPAVEEKVINLTYNVNYNRTQIPGKYCLYFADQINKRSNGRINVVTYAAGSLSAPQDVYESVISGIADIGQHTVAYKPGRHLELEACHIPYSFDDGWVSSKVQNDFTNNFMPKSLDDVHYFFSSAPGPYVLINVKGGVGDVTRPSQLEGQRIRASSIGVDVTEAYGATAVSITVNESYDAAAKGMMDFLILPIEILKGWNFADVSESYTILPLSYATMNIGVMNVDTWNSLPDWAKAIFDDVAADMGDACGMAWWFSDIEAHEHMVAMGGHAVTIPDEYISEWKAPLAPMIANYVMAASAAGLPGADYVKYVQERGQYYNENHPVTEQQAIDFGRNELLTLN